MLFLLLSMRLSGVVMFALDSTIVVVVLFMWWLWWISDFQEKEMRDGWMCKFYTFLVCCFWRDQILVKIWIFELFLSSKMGPFDSWDLESVDPWPLSCLVINYIVYFSWRSTENFLRFKVACTNRHKHIFCFYYQIWGLTSMNTVIKSTLPRSMTEFLRDHTTSKTDTIQISFYI